MTNHDVRIDTSLAKSADCTQPMLPELGALIHKACPKSEDVVKWGMPYFHDRGSSMRMMSAFNQGGSFGFWLGKPVVGESAKNGMGQLGRINSLNDLPPKRQLISCTKKTMALNGTGATLTRRKAAKPTPAVPDDFAALLRQKKPVAARRALAGFGPDGQREYIDWITEAKITAIRQKRVTTTREWLTDGSKGGCKHAKAAQATKP